jgi:hypothetical protein
MSYGRWFITLGDWGILLNLRRWGFGIDRFWYDAAIFILSIGPLHISRAAANGRLSREGGEGET